MITSEERRAIAERIGEYDWDNGDYATTALLLLAQCLGVDDEDISGRSYGYIARMVADKVRELCEVSDDDVYQRGYDEGFASADNWYADRTEGELYSRGLIRLPKGADGEPIRPGDVVTHPDMGGRREVTSVCLTGEGVSVGCSDGFVTLRTGLLSHADTPSTLADEIDRWVYSEQDESHDELRAIARRLRALGGGE